MMLINKYVQINIWKVEKLASENQVSHVTGLCCPKSNASSIALVFGR